MVVAQFAGAVAGQPVSGHGIGVVVSDPADLPRRCSPLQLSRSPRRAADLSCCRKVLVPGRRCNTMTAFHLGILARTHAIRQRNSARPNCERLSPNYATWPTGSSPAPSRWRSYGPRCVRSPNDPTSQRRWRWTKNAPVVGDTALALYAATTAVRDEARDCGDVAADIRVYWADSNPGDERSAKPELPVVLTGVRARVAAVRDICT